MDFKKEFLSKDKEINHHYLNRYIKLLEEIQSVESDNYENHHVLPRSIFPEYENTKNNIIAVPTKWHYILHWVMFKIFNDEKYKQQMIFAFNNMKRIIQSEKKKGVLYEMSRKYVADAVSKSNTGRKKTEEQKRAIGERTRGTVIVKDSEGNKFRISKNDPRYISGEVVFYRTGTSHSKKTIENMKNNSGIKGKIPCYDSNGNKKYFFENEIPDGFTKNIPKSQKEKLSLSKKNLLWYNNGIKNIRIKEGKHVPEGFERGKLKTRGFVGWELVNSRRRRKG